MKDFSQKVVVITGAASGIGRALAFAFAKRKAYLALSDIRQDELEETKSFCQNYTKVHTQVLDVSSKVDMQRYSETVVQEFGEVHVVINNAGVALSGTVEETSIEDYEWLMGINWWGVLYGTKFFLPYLRRVSEAHIVNISSLFGLIGVPTQSAYNASKFAVRGFTESLRQELENTHIGVTCVHPGGIKTSIAHNARFISGPGGERDKATVAKRFVEMAQTTAEEAARQIIEAIEQKKPRLLIGPDAVLLDFVVRTFPESYPIFLKPLASRF